MLEGRRGRTQYTLHQRHVLGVFTTHDNERSRVDCELLQMLRVLLNLGPLGCV